ncbi:MAG: PD-(D/E)XK nuclease family protein [Acidobacteriaceae bacterium]|nr:PD-(D/E)XK nuclease family protein [Acidobacteriaceae bacterium]
MRVACPGLSRRLEEACFENKATLVTPSPLVAAVAAQQFSAHRLQSGLSSWERPAIFSIEAWLAASWHEARYNSPEIPTLLSPAQERVLWQTIIQAEHPDLFDLSATARLARRSAQLLAEYHIPSEGEFWNDNLDAQEFQQWNRAFRRKCRDEGWITRADLWALLPQWVGTGHSPPKQTIFAGFTTSTPAMQQLKHALGELAITEPLRGQEPGIAAARSCTDLAEEIEFAARWARTRFEAQPSSSIGIFVPDLAANRSLIERTFRRVFYPSSALSATNGQSGVFHISAGAPLRDQPVIAAALLLLELARPRIHHADACSILRSPYIKGAASERSARALADIELRKLREIDVSLRQVEWASRNCALLSQMWPDVRRIARKRPDHLDLAAWSEFIAALIEALGWPGDADLSVEEQGLVETWKDALSSLIALGMVAGRVSYATALTHLKSILAEPGYCTGDWFSPVQILDSRDAPSLEFDYACLTGLSDETWPPPPNLSALVPLQLQRAHGVPGSSLESARRERERRTAALFSTAPVLAVTYSGRLSPAAEGFCDKHAGNDLASWPGKLPRQSYARTQLDEIEDFKAPPYQSTGETRGGTSLIKAQSLCSFRAFAQKRLNANPLEDACFGFDARDRGTFLHEALRYVWEQLQTQARLRDTSPDELRTLVREAVTRAVNRDQGSAFHEQNSLAERERLENLILDWLLLEAARKQPFAVEMTELKRNMQIAGLDLSIRMDRIDRLRNNKLILLDYKSGEAKRAQLEGERPSEPQLLMYAAALGEDVEGIFFGQLKPRDLRAVGFSCREHFSDRTAEVKVNWHSFLQESRQNIERIARAFLEGYAARDPIKGACEFCGAKAFCRIGEQRKT